MIHSLGSITFYDSFSKVAVCTLGNPLTNSKIGHPFMDQDEQERLNQLCYDLYVPLQQFKA